MHIFKDDFTEDFINEMIEKSIKETLVITNQKSIPLVVGKVKAKLLAELADREKRRLLKLKLNENK